MLKEKESRPDEKEMPFSVYLHRESWVAMKDLLLSYRDRRSIVNSALWSFWKQPKETQLAFVRAFSRVDSEGVPLETPEEKLVRLSTELDGLRKALGITETNAQQHPNDSRRRTPRRRR